MKKSNEKCAYCGTLGNIVGGCSNCGAPSSSLEHEENQPSNIESEDDCW